MDLSHKVKDLGHETQGLENRSLLKDNQGQELTSLILSQRRIH